MKFAQGLALSAALVAVAPAVAGDHKGKLGWEENPVAGLQKARREGLPAMLVFSAEW